MKKIIAVLLAFTTISGYFLINSTNSVTASDSDTFTETEAVPQDPVRLRYQYLLKRGLEEVLAREPFFSYFPDYIGFDIQDVTNDGTEDLIMRRKDENKMYVFDTDKNIVGEFPSGSVFYYNGIAAVLMPQNRHLSMSFKPYTLYGYNPETNKYEVIGSADAWSKKTAGIDDNGNHYPDDIDVSGAGTVYFIDDSEHDKNTPVDESEYIKWKVRYLGGTSTVKFDYKDLTEGNIARIDTALHTPEETTVTTEATTAAPVTTTVTTTTTVPVTTTVTTTTAAPVTTTVTTTTTAPVTTTVTTTTTAPVTTTVTTTTTAVTFKNCEYDVNSDETLNTTDLVALIQYVVNPEKHKSDITRGDINHDGKTNAADIIALRTFLCI